ncbi:MAG: DUF1934 family protein [Solobacterium sp.]|nr:DUF1934 family protein [Solobacterium sp.]
MEGRIRLTQFTAEMPRGTVLAEGRARFSGGILSYAEKDDAAVRHEVLFAPEEIVIRRFGETVTEIILNTAGRGTGTVHTPYGVIEMETELLRYDTEQGKTTVEYRLLQGEQTVLQQTFVWEWKGITDEQN